MVRSSVMVVFIFMGAIYFPDGLMARPIIISHRGASGYLPEHTLPAKALAYGQNADYIEQDVVLTKDSQPIILHDIHLDTVTNVAKKFANRARRDGRYYAIDFTLNEIKQLAVTERFDRETSKPVFPDRFPQWRSHFSVPSLDEEIEMIQGLNKSEGKNVGIYVEIKSPKWHQEQGKDITAVVINTLQRYGYPAKDKLAYLQCFDAQTLKRIKQEFRTPIPLIQLIGENSWQEAPTDFDKMKTAAGIKQVAAYAQGIGPWISHLYTGKQNGKPQLTEMVKWAHQNKLAVHPYTARADALPEGIKDIDELFSILLDKLKVEGLFTDFPDRGVALLNRQGRKGA